MLLTSVREEAELDQKRARFGGCKLSSEKRPPPLAADAIPKNLPTSMEVILRTRISNDVLREPLHLKAEEIAKIKSVNKISRRDIMVMLLHVASSIAATHNQSGASSAVVEGPAGALYVGTPVSWQGKGVKFSVHGCQAAVINAWHHGETDIRSLMTETSLCACCRQSLREVGTWKKIEILVAEGGVEVLKKGTIKESRLGTAGLRLDGISARFMQQPRLSLKLEKSDSELVSLATNAASWSYAPYSRNYAGVAVKTRRGQIYQGRYMEVRDPISGLLAVEAAMMNLVLSGELISDVTEIQLVETQGTDTQFSATQKLVQAMGDVPFHFMMAS